MVLIEQEPDDANEQSRSSPSTGAAAVPDADSSDEEPFEDALNEEQLLEV